jgi:hypothetical protein
VTPKATADALGTSTSAASAAAMARSFGTTDPYSAGTPCSFSISPIGFAINGWKPP